MNSILMGMQKKPLTNVGMKLLFIPCLILTLTLSSFSRIEFKKIKTEASTSVSKSLKFNDVYVWTTEVPAFIDLGDGIEYVDIWVDFFDENHTPVTVYNLTLNYNIQTWPQSNYDFDVYQILNGNSQFLLEDNAPYYNSNTNISYVYSLLPGIGYTVYGS